MLTLQSLLDNETFFIHDLQLLAPSSALYRHRDRETRRHREHRQRSKETHRQSERRETERQSQREGNNTSDTDNMNVHAHVLLVLLALQE